MNQSLNLRKVNYFHTHHLTEVINNNEGLLHHFTKSKNTNPNLKDY
jgi:hypothetical protein